MFIYSIRNMIDGRQYIGQTRNSTIKWRWREHSSDLCKGIHSNWKLQRAWNKNGKDRFCFSIIDTCNTIEELNIAEIKYIKKYDCVKNGYNIASGGNAGRNRFPKVNSKQQHMMQLMQDCREGKAPPKYGTPAHSRLKSYTSPSSRLFDSLWTSELYDIRNGAWKPKFRPHKPHAEFSRARRLATCAYCGKSWLVLVSQLRQQTYYCKHTNHRQLALACKYLSFTAARPKYHALQCQNFEEFRARCKKRNFPSDIYKNPSQHYSNDPQWKGLDDCLGYTSYYRGTIDKTLPQIFNYCVTHTLTGRHRYIRHSKPAWMPKSVAPMPKKNSNFFVEVRIAIAKLK